MVETNVLVVANNKSEQAGPECILACVKALEEIKQKRLTLLDSEMRIFDEYKKHAKFAGQPGLGDSFFKWLWNNQANKKYCRLVEITPLNDDPFNFEELPDDPALVDFDRSDRKFVAVALASKRKPKIVNATDTDWWHHKAALMKHRVTIEFLCPDLMR